MDLGPTKSDATGPQPPTAPLVLPALGDGRLAALRRKVWLLALRTLLLAEAPRELRGVMGLLLELSRSDGRALLRELAQTAVHTPLLALHGGILGPVEALDLAVPHLLVALQARGLLPETVLWPRPVPALRGPGGLSRGPWRALLLGPGIREGEGPDGRRRPIEADPEPFHALPWGGTLSLWDGNPLAMHEAHPEKRGNAVDLGGQSPSEWVRGLTEAHELVATALPSWSAELPSSLQEVVPVGWDAERHLSASFREAPALAYMTLHPDPLILAEALLHEVQHGKLNTLLLLDPVLRNGYSTWTQSPVRPDLRPLMGVLLAVHAFVPVAAFHRVLREGDHPAARSGSFARREREVLGAMAQGLRVLGELAEPTAAGSELLAALRALDAWTRRGRSVMEGAVDAVG